MLEDNVIKLNPHAGGQFALMCHIDSQELRPDRDGSHIESALCETCKSGRALLLWDVIYMKPK